MDGYVIMCSREVQVDYNILAIVEDSDLNILAIVEDSDLSLRKS